MDEIARQMRVATAAVPPSRIDLDRLIASDRQRRLHRIRTLSGTGVAAVAAVAVMPMLFGGTQASRDEMALPPIASGSGPAAVLCQTVAPSRSGPEPPLQTYDTVRSRPDESSQRGEARLTEALLAAVDATVPTDVTVVGMVPKCDRAQFAYQPRYREYTTIAMLGRDGQRGHLIVTVHPTAAGAQANCSEAPDRRSCEVWGQGEDGVTRVSTSRDPGGGVLRWAQFQRVDGTSVTVTTDNMFAEVDGTPTLTAPEPLLTLPELVELARAPGLTLYP